MTKNWMLMDAFDRSISWLRGNSWEEWDDLTPDERARIEARYEKNRNYGVIHKLKKGIYAGS